MPNFEIRDGASLDFDKLASFQEHAFAEPGGVMRAETIQTPKYYEWKYLTPWGSARVSIAAINGMLAATLAAVPCVLTDGLIERTGWQLCDIATHPHYRRKGLFRQCLDALLLSLP